MNTRKRILIVDDDATNVALLDRLLRRAGFALIAETTDARLVIPLFASDAPDLVLLDLGMPYIDGFEVISRLRARADGRAVPILVLTADTSSEARDRAIRLGAQDLLTKPIDANELLMSIAALLEPGRPYQTEGAK